MLSLAGAALALPYPYPMPQEGGYGKQPDGYFQYVNVPAHKEYEFGWNRGNPHHYISRYEQSKDHRFRTRVRKKKHTILYKSRLTWKGNVYYLIEN